MTTAVTQESGTRITCVVVDDHRAVIDAVKELLAAEGMEVVAHAQTGAEALALRSLGADVLVTDYGLPDMTGIEVAGEFIRATPGLGVVLYSAVLTKHGVDVPRRLGVRGFVLKQSPPSELTTAIKVVAAGGTYVDQQLAT